MGSVSETIFLEEKEESEKGKTIIFTSVETFFVQCNKCNKDLV